MGDAYEAMAAMDGSDKEPYDGNACCTCGSEVEDERCPKSKFSCGHHCNCSWTQDTCCWCGIEWGEGGVVVKEPVGKS